ncbi:MAG TPA: ribosome biogenesis GTPase YlqF [Oculatellaceae cyanobacterium]|jgi:ribosome biogenesis GTPase A
MQPGIQWYPGHIAKHERQLKELLKLVDVVVEVLDARIPKASTNPRLENQIRNKPTLIVLNKSDLAEPAQNKAWQAHLTRDNQHAMLYDAKGAQGKQRLIQEVLALGEACLQKLEARGRKRRPLRVLVAGMPNVGKSTLINSIVGRKKAQTGHRAGVTRQTQWVRIHPDIELLDSPGIIPPRLDSEEAGSLLATVSSVGDAAFDEEEIARFLLARIEILYPGLLHQYFKLAPEDALSLETISQVRHYKLGGDSLDTLRAAQAVLTEFRHARLGRITLEHAYSKP